MIAQIKRSTWAMLLTFMVLGAVIPSTVHAGDYGDGGYNKIATASVSVTPATCDSGAKLVYGAISHAAFSGTHNGTTGPANYTVYANADWGYKFSNNSTKLTFSGALAGKLTGEQCTPVVLKTATATVNKLPATCTAGEKLSFSGVLYATASGTADGTTGPGSYDVIFTANAGAQFDSKGTKILEFTGTLAGPLTGVVCTPVTTQTPATPVAAQPIKALPYTAGSDSTAVVVGGGLLTTLLGLAGLRRLLGRSL